MENSHLQKKSQMDLKAMRLQIPIFWSSVQTDFEEHKIFSQAPPDKVLMNCFWSWHNQKQNFKKYWDKQKTN